MSDIRVIRGNVERVIDDSLLDSFKEQGYKTVDEYLGKNEEKDTESVSALNVDLKDLTADKLKEMAKERGLTGYSSLTKEELIAVLSK
ncbi:hypothetical protein B7939_01215 [Eggerthia catenaformis]|nr:hypothetical protein B7939_01215 [Eggerthia catenaformis]